MVLRVGIREGDLVGDTNAVIQRAVDLVALNGGGTVELAPGVYTFVGSLHMRSSVRLAGSGRETVLRRCSGPASLLVVDADGEQTKVTVADASAFRPDMDITVAFDDGSLSHTESRATVMLVKGNTLYLDRRLAFSYSIDRSPVAFSGFPLISFSGVYAASVERLCVDGNRAGNRDVNCWGIPGISLKETSCCRISECLIRDAASDGIVGSVSRDISIEGCEAAGNKYFGIHLGSGTTRAAVGRNACVRNGWDGLYLCWRVQEGRFEGNECRENLQHGISIGHKDTDNVFVGNTVRANKGHGVYFRPGPNRNTGNRNTFRENTIQDNGDCGIYIEAETTDLLFERNTIGDTRPGPARTQRIGICAAPGTSRVRCLGNEYGNQLTAATEGGMEDQATDE